MSEANPDAEFLDHSSISYFIPSRTNFKVEQTLKQAAESHRSLLDAINQRKSLFFDETVDVYLVLRTLSTDEHTLRPYLSRLILSLETQIVNSQPSDRESPPVNEVIFTGSPDDIENPIVVLDGEDDGDGEDSESQGQYILAIWKFSVFLERPRLRLQNPSVIFTVTAELKPADAISGLKDGYLPSGMACGMNLLESFGNDPALSGVRPRLSALRVSRVAPLTNERHQIRSIKAQKNLTLRIYPVVHTRVRFARPNTAPPSPAILALLEVDFTTYFDCEIVLDKITLAVADGMVEDLNSSEGMKLPLSCVAHDHVTFLYRLTPTDLDSPSKQLVRNLEITIDATALVRPAKCHPRLTMSWHTSLDFTLPVNPGFGPATQPIQRSHKPSQLSISGGGDISSLKSPSLTRPDAIPALEAAARSEAAAAATPPEIGIAVTLAGPGSPVYVGDVFSWNVFVVNHASPNVAPGTATGTQRKLALIAIPNRRRNDVRTARPPSFSGSTSGKGKLELLADAVVDETVVHVIQRGAVVEAPDVVCLSADTRIGPLAPGACHVAELKFLALKEGILGIEALRVVDLGSNEHVDVFDLPIIVVEKREG